MDGLPIARSRADGGTQPAAGDAPLVGVLALQGAVEEHLHALGRCGARASIVRTADQLEGVDALVLPGGESTAIRMAIDRAGLREPLLECIASGLPVLGTCAGLVVLGRVDVDDGAPPTLGVLDVTLQRNGFGRQLASFEGRVVLAGELGGDPIDATFIRAPRVVVVGDAATVVGRLVGGPADGEPVAVVQGDVAGASFHTELVDELALHRWLVERARARVAAARR